MTLQAKFIELANQINANIEAQNKITNDLLALQQTMEAARINFEIRVLGVLQNFAAIAEDCGFGIFATTPNYLDITSGFSQITFELLEGATMSVSYCAPSAPNYQWVTNNIRGASSGGASAHSCVLSSPNCWLANAASWDDISQSVIEDRLFLFVTQTFNP
jgi:hypothetical protein